MAETGGKGVDVILDMVGGDYVQRNMDALAMAAASSTSPIRKAPASKSISASCRRASQHDGDGASFPRRQEKGRIRDEVAAQVWPLIEQGRIRPVIDRSFPLADAQKAHACMRESAHIGKILLTL